MSASESPALDAIAFQLVTALEKYDVDSARMVDTWPELDLYHEASKGVETIRMYSAALPAARVQWVELLIAHAELVHFLWRVQFGHMDAAREEMTAVREHHSDCVAALRNRCLRLIAERSAR